MKKQICVMMAALLLLSGCGGKAEETTAATAAAQETAKETTEAAKESAAEETKAPSEEKEASSEVLDVVNMAEYWNEYSDHGNLALASAPCLTVNTDGYDALQESLDEYSAERISWAEENFNEIVAQAKEDFADMTDEIYGYSYEIDTKVMRADHVITSMLEEIYSFLGGAHPNSMYTGVNFDSATGALLNLEDVAADYDAIYEKVLSEIGMMEQEMLFPEYKETIKGIFYDHTESLPWYLDGKGLNIMFNPYVIAPYAAGTPTVTIPYADAAKYLKPEYLIDRTSYAEGVQSYVPYEYISKEGINYTLSITRGGLDEESMTEEITIQYGTDENNMKEFKYTLEGYFESAALLATKDHRNYLYVDGVGMNDYHIMEIFDLNGEEIAHVGNSYAALHDEAPWNPDSFVLTTRLDALGTYSGRMMYHVGDDGMPVADGDAYRINPKWSYQAVLKTLQPFTVWTEDGKEMEIPAGTELTPFETDGGSYVRAFMNDGSICEIRYDQEGWERTIGGISEYELFESLPYAG